MKLYYWLYKRVPYRKLRGFITRRLHEKEGFGYSPTIRKIFLEVHGIEIGYGSVKSGCLELSNIKGRVRFGNYCSIARTAKFFTVNHPIDCFTSHAITYNPRLGYVKKDCLNRQKTLVIGHDVWIGENALVLPSVNSIGNGAIIGAGSVVTKDVEPYTIVGGNPAKPIRKRFNEETIRLLEESRWWLLEKDELIKKMDYLKSIANSKEING